MKRRGNARRRRLRPMSIQTTLRVAGCAAMLVVSACREARISRNGPAQQSLIARTYARPMAELRRAILQGYAKAQATGPEMFRILSISEQPPPGFEPDWIMRYIDPSGFLEPYRRLSTADQANDLVLREPTDDRYWPSEYEANGRPVPFRCALIMHFTQRGPGMTEVQVFEVVPTVWVGERWERRNMASGSANTAAFGSSNRP
jgi:hypothetical protein